MKSAGSYIRFANGDDQAVSFWRLLGEHRQPIVMWVATVIAPLLITLYLVLSYYDVRVNRRHTVNVFQRAIQEMRFVANQPAKGENVEKNDIGWYVNHPYVGYKSPASVHGVFSPTSMEKMSHEYFLNHYGHRSPDLGVKGPNTLRVAMTGGSVAFNARTNEQTIVAELAKILKQRTGREVEYINASIVSGNSSQELAVVAHELVGLQVDILISFDGYNDIANLLRVQGRVGWPASEATGYYPKIEAIPNPTAAQLDELVGNYLKNIQGMAALSRGFGMKYLAIVHPYAAFSSSDFNLNKAKDNPYTYYYWHINQVLQEWDKQHKLDAGYLPLLDFFEHRKQHFQDETHLTDEAHIIVAEHIADILAEKGWI